VEKQQPNESNRKGAEWRWEMHPQLLQLDIWLMSGEEKRRFWLQFFFFFTILHSPLTNCENCQRAVWGGSQKSNRQLATCNSKSATVQHVELLAKLQILSQLNNCHTKTRERKKKNKSTAFFFSIYPKCFLFYQFFLLFSLLPQDNLQRDIQAKPTSLSGFYF